MQNKISKSRYKGLRHLVSCPFILGMSIPMVVLDITMEIYHHICFPLYGIPIVKRSQYICIDRQKLSYLNGWDKLWCMYCGYANGLMAYGVRLAGETEKYWCGIKHKSVGGFVEQPHQKDFLAYGDEKAYREFLKK